MSSFLATEWQINPRFYAVLCKGICMCLGMRNLTVMGASPQQLLIKPLPHDVHAAGLETGSVASCQWCAITGVQSRYNLSVWLQLFFLCYFCNFPRLKLKLLNPPGPALVRERKMPSHASQIRFSAFSYWHSETNKQVTPLPPSVWPYPPPSPFLSKDICVYRWQSKYLNPSQRFFFHKH